MRGSILYRNGAWEISVYIPVDCRDSGPFTVRKYEGRRFTCTVPQTPELTERQRREWIRAQSTEWKQQCSGYREAERCLTFIRTDIEKRSFRRDRYLGPGIVDTIGFLYDWLESQSLTPAGLHQAVCQSGDAGKETGHYEPECY